MGDVVAGNPRGVYRGSIGVYRGSIGLVPGEEGQGGGAGQAGRGGPAAQHVGQQPHAEGGRRRRPQVAQETLTWAGEGVRSAL